VPYVCFMGAQIPWDWLFLAVFCLQSMMGTAALFSGRLSRWWQWALAATALFSAGLSVVLVIVPVQMMNAFWLVALVLGIVSCIACWLMLHQRSRKQNNEALEKLREQHAQRRLLQNGITLVRQNVEMREAIRASKRRNLRSQMNPHFLFNVLTGVQHLLIRDQREKALHIFERFRHLLLQSFQVQHKVVGSVAEELDHVRQYIDLELQRVSGPFEWSIICGEDVNIQETPCPLLVLQPLVENAIWHGLQGGRMNGGHIRIAVFWEGYDLVLTVQDNGKPHEGNLKAPDLGNWSDGTPKTEFKRDPKHGSRALSILKERLALFRHKGSFSLEKSPPDHFFDAGMCARIHLPFWRIQDLREWREKEKNELDWLDGLRPEVKERYEALNREAQAAAREVETLLKKEHTRSRRNAS